MDWRSVPEGKKPSEIPAGFVGPAALPVSERRAIVRLLDANTNRACEGLRVLEDHARFVENQGPLVAALKEIRHELVDALADIPHIERVAARDTLTDVGVDISCAGEFDRPNVSSIVAANWSRVKQSVRSLEEYAKPLSQAAAARIEKIRYRLYVLEAKSVFAGTRVKAIAGANLYVLVDGGASADDFERRIATLVQCGVDVIQLRDKELDDRDLLHRACQLRSLTRDGRSLFIMNDRPDIAVVAEADGVHLGQTEMPVALARRIVGPGALIGVSTHELAQVGQAIADGADYLGCGPTFASSTKAFSCLAGPDFLEAARGATADIPAFAIGGIRLDNLDRVLASGFQRIAVGHAIWEAEDPVHEVNAFRTHLDSGRGVA